MFRNYVKTAWRHLVNGKIYSFILISGLAIGMSVALLIGLWVHYMYSYNRFLPGYKQAYQVKLNFSYNGNILTQSGAPLPLADALRKNIPGIRYVAESGWVSPRGVSVGEKKVYLNAGIMGSDFFRIFPFPFITGDAATALQDPYSIVLTESAAKSLFGTEEALNKLVRFENAHDLKVTGILKDLPGNSSFQFDCIIPFSYSEQTDNGVKQSREQWRNNSFPIYVALQPHASYEQVARQISNLAQVHEQDAQAKIEVMLHPFEKWRLYAIFEGGKATGGFIEYVRIFGIIGIMVLLIACINFINLSTARSEKRAREVGVRKVIGSERKDLVFQFLAESLVISFIAFLVSLLIAQLALPGFNELAQSKMHIPFSSPLFWCVMAGYVLLTGLLAGIRPALYFSSFAPICILKGTFKTGKTASWPRKVLVVIQFSCSIALIIGTLIIYNQVQYARNRPAGYDKDGLLAVDMSSDLSRNYTPFKNELLQSGTAASVTKSSTSLDGFAASFAISDWPGKKKNESLEMAATAVSEDYFKTVGMRIKGGREFLGESDTMNLILNESAVKRLHLEDPVNKLISVEYTSVPMRVIGVVGDAVMGSPFQAAVPTLFIYNSRWAGAVLLRLSDRGDLQDGLARLRQVCKKYNPSYPLVFHFVDEQYAHKFDAETQTGKLIALFATLAILISCLGLFGLAAYMAEQRTKEIGIRKVLGASVGRMVLMLSGDFLLLVGISSLLASPVAYYFLHQWLAGYYYRIAINPLVFVLAAFTAIVITALTVGFQSLKSALMNPVNSLRSE
jgi:ABC-type antimicrobial peptide transport system permease subunit